MNTGLEVKCIRKQSPGLVGDDKEGRRYKQYTFILNVESPPGVSGEHPPTAGDSTSEEGQQLQLVQPGEGLRLDKEKYQAARWVSRKDVEAGGWIMTDQMRRCVWTALYTAEKLKAMGHL